MSQEQGIATLNKAIAAATEEIERHKGKLAIKDAPRTVSSPFNPSFVKGGGGREYSSFFFFFLLSNIFGACNQESLLASHIINFLETYCWASDVGE